MKFPYYKQHDSMQCGITCLQMICKHYGKEFSIETLSRYCFATTEGVSLLGISEAANKLGLHSICGRVSMEQMREAPLPYILHRNQNHFVVLYKQKQGKKFYIADPGKGLVAYSRKEFVEHWISTRSKGEEKGIAMFLPASPTTRENVTVYVSEDNGETWTPKRCIYKGYSAYSSLQVLDDGTIGIIVEEGKWDGNLPGEDGFNLGFYRFSIDWLLEGDKE